MVPLKIQDDEEDIKIKYNNKISNNYEN